LRSSNTSFGGYIAPHNIPASNPLTGMTFSSNGALAPFMNGTNAALAVYRLKVQPGRTLLITGVAGGRDGEKALGTLKRGGQFIGIATENGEPSQEQCTAAGVRCIALRRAQSGDPTEHDLLSDVGRLANEGKLKMKLDSTFPLEQAAAGQELSREGHTEGKIVLLVDTAKANQK
jgi:NADPH:quinone reductase-like Zn-dependent oxidoreductase